MGNLAYAPYWFRSTAVFADGNCFESCWKAHWYKQSGRCQWSLFAPVKAILSRKNFRLCREISVERSWWDSMFGYLGWALDDELPPTVRQAQWSNSEALDTSREQATLSTRGFLAVLVWWSHGKRGANRDRAGQVLRSLLQRVVGHLAWLPWPFAITVLLGTRAACIASM